jgi:hypothetical protein
VTVPRRQGRRDEEQQLVDQVRLEERRRDCPPALQEERLDALLGEPTQSGVERPRDELKLAVGGKRAAAEDKAARLADCGDVARF